MKLKLTIYWLTALILSGCAESERPGSEIPQPTEIIDLGTLITEDTPERFWGKRFKTEMGLNESNSFRVISWDFGPVSGSNAYYTIFNHGGPHIDAPNHMGLGEGLDSYAIESFMGPLRVFDFSHLSPGRTITREMLEGRGIESDDIVIIYTRYVPPRTDADLPETIALTYEAAGFLANLPVRAFGTDAFAVASLTDQSPVAADSEIARAMPAHYAFLSRGIPIYEQLVNVNQLIGKERMFFVGVPLNIEDGDGMIVRPVVLVY